MPRPRLAATLRAVRPAVMVTESRPVERFVAAFRRDAETDGRAGAFGLAVDVAVQYAEAKEHKRFGTGSGPSAKLAVQHDVLDRGIYAEFRHALGERRCPRCWPPSSAGLTSRAEDPSGRHRPLQQ
ncbi:hypothetical protein [Streptomyces sp. NPDC057301]|uniref:hypothetical protein n=1 Tax=Streptomyces sp. NPDC057301 TaxID=3346093 RepID=UPI00362BC33F